MLTVVCHNQFKSGAMKSLSTHRLFVFTVLICLVISCKKNAVEPSFTATVNNEVYLFDSLFAWIDTSSASLNNYFINIGAKDTKGNNFIYFVADSYGDKNFTGSYYYDNSLPYPLPDSYKWLNGGSGYLNTGQNQRFNLGGNGISNLSIEKVTGSTLKGNFSFLVNPTLNNGSTDVSQSLSITGQFNMPYRVIP